MGRIVETTKRRSWRRSTYIWMLSALAAVSALLYWEQTALLYVLSTLAMCILLIVVAFSDLEGRDSELNKQVDSDRTHRTESDVTTGSSSPVLADPQALKRHKGAARRATPEGRSFLDVK
jgi:hypothetical protein